jgi:hypothetical protein
MLPFMLQNLKSRRRILSATVLPFREPQHASLYADRVEDAKGEGGRAWE